MEILQDENQAALNDLLSMCSKSADHFQAAAEQVENDRVQKLFESLRLKRMESIDELTRIVRASQTLPRVPDTDREQVEQLFTRVKAMFSENSQCVFIEACMEYERQLEELAGYALDLQLAGDSQECVQQLRYQSQMAVSRLKDARARLSAS